MDLSRYVLQNDDIDCPNCQEEIYASDVIDDISKFDKPTFIECPHCQEKVKVQMSIEVTAYMERIIT